MRSSCDLILMVTLFRLGSTGRLVTLTTDNLAYQKANGLGVPITGRSHVILEVKVCKGAEIQLLESDTGAWVYYKLGGDNNEWSAMAASQDCDGTGCTWVDYVEVPAVDCNVSKPFWVSWDAWGSHMIGIGDVIGANVIMGAALIHFDVNFFQVSNFDDGVSAEWKFLIDEPPLFTNPTPLGNTVVDVSEDTGVGSIVYTVEGTDEEGDSLFFTFDTHTDMFEFDGADIKTLQTLDYENVTSYLLLISMSDGRNTQQAMMTLRVTDVVDEAPVITLPLTLQMPEELPVATPVFGLFTVEDGDEGDTLNYTIHGTHSSFFSIDTNTGVLSTARRIDRDQAALTSVTFNLQVTDSNNLQATESITVAITDINDNDPSFSATSYTVDVTENTASDTSLLDFTVTDPDEGVNADYAIAIVAGDDVAAKFKVVGSELHTGPNSLDYETESKYTLTVTATNDDNTRTGTTTVTIQVMSENEADPVFVSPTLNASNQFPEQVLSENIPLNHEIPFSASDADLGADGDVTFSIVSILDSNGADGSSSFSIDRLTGTLRIIQPLDSDTGGIVYYDATIMITDGGSSPRSTNGTLRLMLTNINDNAPEFDATFYTASIAEDAVIGATVGTVVATDIDEDLITYTVDGSWSGVFEITGNDVITKTFLDYATTPLYVITIRADDGQFQTDVLMTISVVQTSTSTSTFQLVANPDMMIKEEQGEGSVIAGVFKTVGNTGAVTYSLEGPNAVYMSIDPVSGVLTYGSERIDRDGSNGRRTLSDITLKGVDGAGAIATADLSFVITDVNDNAPVAANMVSTVEVRENSSDNQLLLTFTLSDADEGSNSDVSLSISSGDTDIFSITDHTLYMNGGKVDYEALPVDKKYHLILFATDNPTKATAMTTAVQVVVQVLGQNEYSPTWVSPIIGADFTFADITVSESASLGETVVTFVAADSDDGDDGLIVYSVEDIRDPSGLQAKDKFVMTSDGRLVVGSQLDYDAETGGVSFYVVTVAASDSSSILVKSITGTIQINLENVESENQLLLPRTSTQDATPEMWVMRALVAVLGVAVLALGSVMLKSIISGGVTSRTSSTAKVSPNSMTERAVTITPNMSLASVRINDEDDHFSWIEREDAMVSHPPLSAEQVPSIHSMDSSDTHHNGKAVDSTGIHQNGHSGISTHPLQNRQTVRSDSIGPNTTGKYSVISRAPQSVTDF